MEGELYFVCSLLHHIFSADITKAHQTIDIVKLYCPYCGVESYYNKKLLKPIPYYNNEQRDE